MDREKRQKYFVNHQDAVTIRCKVCGRTGTYSVAALRGHRHSLKVNCPCTEIFAIDLEFRHDFRVSTHIPATFRAISTPKDRAKPCIVANRSYGGLLLHISGDVPVKANDRLTVSFQADDERSPVIERIITVRHHERGQSIGGSFADITPTSASGAATRPH